MNGRDQPTLVVSPSKAAPGEVIWSASMPNSSKTRFPPEPSGGQVQKVQKPPCSSEYADALGDQ